MYIIISHSPKYIVRRSLEKSLWTSYSWRQEYWWRPLSDQWRYRSASNTAWRYGCIISHQPVGLDIELVTPRSSIIYDQVMSTLLIEARSQIFTYFLDTYWDGLDDQNISRYIFYTLWTAKEAIIKLTNSLLDDHKNMYCVWYYSHQHTLDTIVCHWYLLMEYRWQIFTISAWHITQQNDILVYSIILS